MKMTSLRKGMWKEILNLGQIKSKTHRSKFLNSSVRFFFNTHSTCILISIL